MGAWFRPLLLYNITYYQRYVGYVCLLALHGDSRTGASECGEAVQLGASFCLCAAATAHGDVACAMNWSPPCILVGITVRGRRTASM